MHVGCRKKTKQEVYVPNATLKPSVSSVVVLVNLLGTSVTSDWRRFLAVHVGCQKIKKIILEILDKHGQFC